MLRKISRPGSPEILTTRDADDLGQQRIPWAGHLAEIPTQTIATRQIMISPCSVLSKPTPKQEMSPMPTPGDKHWQVADMRAALYWTVGGDRAGDKHGEIRGVECV